MKLLWIVPEKQGGIRTYAEGLWPALRGEMEARGWSCGVPVFALPEPRELGRQYGSGEGLVIHVQHEYGLFGSKIPGFYRFPSWVRAMRRHLPRAKLVCTAHSVISQDFRYPLRGRGWQIPGRWLANQVFLPFLKRVWGEGTWKGIDGVIVHSQTQVAAIREAGAVRVEAIPHYVYARGWDGGRRGEGEARDWGEARSGTGRKRIAVFGYLTPEKGQDLAIEAVGLLKKRGVAVELTLAGGLRRKADQAYWNRCQARIGELGLRDDVHVTGFVPEDQIERVYREADLVVAPFRETSGSGSLALAFAMGAAVLASDLPLNREMVERMTGAMEYFRTGDVEDLARKAEGLLADGGRRAAMKERARAYAEAFSPEKIARMHGDFYVGIKGA